MLFHRAFLADTDYYNAMARPSTQFPRLVSISSAGSIPGFYLYLWNLIRGFSRIVENSNVRFFQVRIFQLPQDGKIVLEKSLNLFPDEMNDNFLIIQ